MSNPIINKELVYFLTDIDACRQLIRIGELLSDKVIPVKLAAEQAKFLTNSTDEYYRCLLNWNVDPKTLTFIQQK